MILIAFVRTPDLALPVVVLPWDPISHLPSVHGSSCESGRPGIAR